MPDAASISVRETLDLLSGQFATFAAALFREQYALWLGSGISRDRVPGVGELVTRVLEHLRLKADFSDPSCCFRAAFEECLALAMLSDLEKPEADVARPIESWSVHSIVVDRVTRRYSELLNVSVEGEAPDYMLWNALDVIGTYAPIDAEPDCEHFCLAILILEGSVTNMVSANWDGLIEIAVEVLAGGSERPLQVCVLPSDLLGPPGRCVMYKLHGCAVLARDDPDVYRGLLVARARQITGWTQGLWSDNPKNRLIDLAATHRTLMMGLSAQDSNIQFIFAQGSERAAWTWPCDPPSHVFAEDSIGDAQRSILEQAYKADYDAHRGEINEGSLLRAFAKPLLVALVLDLLAAKFETALDMSNAVAVSGASRDQLASGLSFLKTLVAVEADGDRLAFIRLLIAFVYRANCLFRDGQPTSSLGGAYRPISSIPLTRMEHDADIVSSGLVETSVALGIIGAASEQGYWQISAEDPAIDGAGVIKVSASSQARVFFVSNPGAAVKLFSDVIDPSGTDDVVVVHSQSPIARPRRSPKPFLRSRSVGPREIGMADLLSDCHDSGELIQRMREEVGV